MPIDQTKVVVLYRNDPSDPSSSADSLTFAQAYQQMYSFRLISFLGVVCSGSEILSTYSDFQTQIEDPLKELALSLGSIEAILVGYGVPGGFYDPSGAIVSTTSRLSRFGTQYTSYLFENPFYNRTYGYLLGPSDFSNVVVASRIDAPTLQQALDILGNSEFSLNYQSSDGTFFISPFPTQTGDPTLPQYASDLSDFVNITLPAIDINVYSTSNSQNEENVFLPSVQYDSFLWNCVTTNVTSSFFLNSNFPRIFFYNAGGVTGLTLRNPNDTEWAYNGLISGYCSCGATMYFTNSSQYLRPTPFFNSLISGATVGEAYIFGIPFLDCGETLFGDPLLKVKIGSTQPFQNYIQVNLAMQFLIDTISQAICCIYQMQQIAQQLNILISSYTLTGVPSEDSLILNLKNASLGYMNTVEDNYLYLFTNLVASIWQLILSSTTSTLGSIAVNNFLSQNNLIIQEIFSDVMTYNGISVDNSLILPTSGEWNFYTIIDNVTPDVANYTHFLLEISVDPSFSPSCIVATINSSLDQSGWVYEKYTPTMVPVPSEGVWLGYSGRYVGFQSGTIHELKSGSVYYVKFSQIVNGTTFNVSTDVLAVSG